MYETGKISDLIFTEDHEAANFVKSDLDEVEYFNCDVNNLVSLRDYLVELKKKKEEYDRLIEEPLKSIQKKNPWCIDVQPVNKSNFNMEIRSKNYPPIYILNNEQCSALSFDSIAYYGYYNPILKSLYLKRYNKRSSIAYNSKDELLEIKRIIESFGFVDEWNGLITASKHFVVIPYNFEEIHIQKKRPGYYSIIKLNKNGGFSSNCCGFITDNKDSKKYANELVKKLYLVKKNKI